MSEQIECLLAKDDYRSFIAKEIRALQREVRRLRTDPEPDSREGLVEIGRRVVEKMDDAGCLFVGPTHLCIICGYEPGQHVGPAHGGGHDPDCPVRALRDRLREAGDGDDG